MLVLLLPLEIGLTFLRMCRRLRQLLLFVLTDLGMLNRNWLHKESVDLLAETILPRLQSFLHQDKQLPWVL